MREIDYINSNNKLKRNTLWAFRINHTQKVNNRWGSIRMITLLPHGYPRAYASSRCSRNRTDKYPLLMRRFQSELWNVGSKSSHCTSGSLAENSGQRLFQAAREEIYRKVFKTKDYTENSLLLGFADAVCGRSSAITTARPLKCYRLVIGKTRYMSIIWAWERRTHRNANQYGSAGAKDQGCS